jgi:DNA-binding PadR family transcriptional regulator
MRGFFFRNLHRCGEHLDDAFWAARHGRHHGFGGFGGFGAGIFGGRGLGGFDFRMGRKLASGDLQLVLLALLAEQPSHGYELIKALEQRSEGFYTPSPGMVYPALTWLEEMGYATVEADGAKKLYRISDAGREYLTQNREAAAAMLHQLERIGRKLKRVRDMFSGLEDDEDAAGYQDLWDARQDLRSALRDLHHASGAERERVAKILREAAARIRGTQ